MIQYVDHSMIYYGLPSSSSDKVLDDTVCRSQYDILWFTVK